MESSIGPTLEKIKLQGHDTEAKLKEKRAYEATIASLNRGVRDALTNAAKLQHELTEAVARTETLSLRLELEKSRRYALSSALENTQKELQMFQVKSVQRAAAVWNQRSLLCKSVQNVSDQCDVRALLAKPKTIQLPMTKKVHDEIIVMDNGCDERLKNAIERRTKILAERDRLQSEPDTGEEFLR